MRLAGVMMKGRKGWIGCVVSRAYCIVDVGSPGALEPIFAMPYEPSTGDPQHPKGAASVLVISGAG